MYRRLKENVGKMDFNQDDGKTDGMTVDDAQSDAEQSSVDAVIYHITHDLRAAMRALMILPDWIDEDLGQAGIVVPETVKDHLTLLRTQTKRLDRMMLDLREYSRIGRLADSSTIVDFDAMLREICTDLSLEERFEISMDLQISKLRGPRNDLMRMFTAILENVRKHHDKRSGCISVTSHAQASGLTIDIADDGPGIDSRYHKKVFEMMTTLARRDEVEGTGLGLSIAKRVIESMRGSVSIRPSKFNRGLTVRIALPLTAAVPN